MQAPGDNLVKNGDFLNWGNEWTILGSSNCASFYSAPGENNYAILTSRNPAGCFISQKISVIPNREYSISARASILTTPPGIAISWLQIYYKDNENRLVYPLASADINKVNEWQIIVENVNPKIYRLDNPNAIVDYIELNLADGGGGRTYITHFDDVEVRESKIPLCEE